MDIAGFWTGKYAYDEVIGLVVEFHAGLSQTGSILSGNTTERNTFGGQDEHILIAELFGKVSLQSIRFMKRYTNVAQGQEKIIYSGSISNDGNAISGSWVMMSMWSGTFTMSRAIEQKPKEQSVALNNFESV